MPQGKTKLVPLLAFAVDVLLLLVSFSIASYFKFGELIPEDVFYYSLLIGWVVVWVLMVLKFNLYEIPRILYIDKILSKDIKALLIFIFLSGAIIYFATSYKFSRVFFSSAMLCYAFLHLIWRLIFLFIVKKYRGKRKNLSKIVFVGVNRNIFRLVNRVYTNPSFGFEIDALFTDADLKNGLKEYYKGGLKDVIHYLDTNKIDEIIISLPHHKGDFINELLHYGDNNMIRVRVIPEFSEYLSKSFSIDYVESIPVMKFRKEPLQSLSNRILKRGFDIGFSLLLVTLVFSWLFPIIAVIIKLTSKGPVFFGQSRTGKNGVSFKCLKFRSMTVNSDSDEVQATRNDARITPFGAFMRKTSIDELPQILNVLMNHMSLVGPRPHMLKHTEEYRVLVDKFMVRHFAKPGVTGWAQISGYRGETKEVRDMKNRAEADIWYIENWSFLLDLKIIIRTAWTMLFKKDDNAF